MSEEQTKELDLSDVIKNPARTTQQVQEKYVPEYVRLNKEPIIKDSPKTFSSVDEEFFDDDGLMSAVPQGHIIDNNDYVNLDATVPSSITETAQSVEEVSDTTSTPKVGEYILMVFNKSIASGSLNVIEARVSSIIYGDDSSFAGRDVDISDVVVLKRVGIKFGVFVGE